MYESETDRENLSIDEPSPPRGHSFLAWCAIILLAGWTVAWQNDRAEKVEKVEVKPPLTAMELESRVLVAAAEWSEESTEDFYKQAKPLDAGPFAQRIRFVVLAGELSGPEKALKQLAELKESVQKLDQENRPPAEELALLPILEKLYRGYKREQYDPVALTEEEQDHLRENLGWFGQLALVPREGPNQAEREQVLAPAERTAAALMGGIGGAFLLGVLGFFGLLILLALLFSGKVQGLQTGATHGGVYAETFAIWLLVFMALTLGSGLLPKSNSRLAISGLLSLSSLLVLAWPVWRGISWGQVRQDIGLNSGRQPILEPACGVATYAMSLPLLAAGLAIMFGLLFLQRTLSGGGGGETPSHPIVDLVPDLDLWGKIQLLFVASVTAPVVEEIMFRGVLYRHLREATGRWSFVLSFLFSAMMVSFIFAVIHPQGLVAVPVLMGLALGFTVGREWRGTLVPSVVAHGISNGLVMAFLFIAFGH